MSQHCHEKGCSCDHVHEESTVGCDCGCAHEREEQESWMPLLVCGVLFVLGLVIPSLLDLPVWCQPIWMGLVALPSLYPVLVSAMRELHNRTMGEHVLLVIAAVAAFAIGEGVEGALVLLLFDLGERLEEGAMSYSRRTIAALTVVIPDAAWRVNSSGKAVEIPATSVCIGDTLYIPPHSRIPVDCRVVSGHSPVDCSILTGESESMYASAGSELLSGCVNGSGELTAVALRPCEESAAARILRLVEEAVSRKGNSERFITRFARIYTPLVTVAAVAVAVLPPLLNGGWLTWLYRALAFLVASCPCALVISVPLGFYAGIAAAARQGVLLKGGSYVEKLASVKGVAFDKTGTLTTGELTLVDVIPLADLAAGELLRLAAALEQHSTHPVGRAICWAVKDELPLVKERQELPGLGVIATIDGHRLACGGSRLLGQLGVSDADIPPASVYLTRDNRAIAAIRLASALQEGADRVAEQLRRVGVKRLVMLSGDRQEEVDAVGKAVGITGEVYGGLLPEDKLAAVQDLQANGLVTAFVGDGINDAPVLAAADIGIAMELGSQAAIETADGVLVSGGLSRLPTAIRLCKRVVRTVRINIVFSLGVKALVLALAVCGIAPMWLAVFADMGVTLLSVCHALTVLLFRG